MMKNLISILLLFVCLNAIAKEKMLLTSKEFQSLSHENQVKYLRELQKIFARMTQNTLYMAGHDEVLRMPAASSIGEDATRMDKSDRDKLLSRMQNEAPAYKDPVREPEVQVNPTPSPLPVKGSYPKVDLQTTAAEVKPEPKVSSKPAPASAPAPTPKPAAETPKPKAIAKDQVVQEKPEPKPAPSPAPAASTVSSKKTNPKDFRCMHSGWLVKKDPCKAQNIVDLDPPQTKFESLVEGMTCPKGQSMCYPILYGMILPEGCTEGLEKCIKDGKDVKPICANVPPWKYPTKKCGELANEKTTQVAVEINTKISPEIYEQYKDDFEDLCDTNRIEQNEFVYKDARGRPRKDPAAVFRDIDQTCQSARVQLDNLKNVMLVTTSAAAQKKPAPADSSKDTKTQK